MCVSDSVAIKVINTVNQGMEGRFGNGGRLKVIVTEPDPGEEKRDRQTDRQSEIIKKGRHIERQENNE